MLGLLVVSGCGSSMGNVEGTVKYQGKAVKSGMLMFIPPQGPPTYAEIKNDGSYAAADVPPGEIKVVVNSPDPRGPTIREGSPLRDVQKNKPPPDPNVLKEWFPLPAEYGDMETTKLKITVTSGKNQIPLELK